MAGPLGHVRVLDLSRVLAGPWAGQNLADLGAEVIKVERPGAGDDSRAFGPPWVKDRSGAPTKDSAYFTSANRGKKSITVNVAKPEGQALIRSLAAKCDVLIENYKHGDLARYGLGYEDLKKVNPRLIYCSVTGFGQTGPYRERPGYDFMIQGMGGMMSVTGEPDGAPGGGPQRAGIAWYVLNPNAGKVVQQGYLGATGMDFTYPAIGVTPSGRGVMAFTAMACIGTCVSGFFGALINAHAPTTGGPDIVLMGRR